MPNWCYNRLEITGEENELNRFKEDVKSKDEEFSLNSLIPIPECNGLKKEELEKIWTKEQIDKCIFDKNGEFDWYHFCINNWGTKWDVSDLDTNHDDDYLNYTFSTAWSPPEEWLDTISLRYKLEFELTSYEEGCDFWFYKAIKDGEVIDRECLTIEEKIMNDYYGTKQFDEIKKEFICKLSELEFDSELNVSDIDELVEIIDQFDLEFGQYTMYNIFNEYRLGFYALKRLVHKKIWKKLK